MRYILFISLFSITCFAEKTSHIWNETLPYEANIDSISLKNRDGKTIGRMFYTAYTKEGADPDTRPLTFCFNGGPGSASIWLHMGAFGPKRVVTEEEGASIKAPYMWIENKESLLEITDLVFIDPIGAGFSRAEGEAKPGQFYDIQEDLTSCADFIYSYITENNRWACPKYLAGESYGTLRAAGLAEKLQGDYGIYLNGLIMVSCAIDFQTIQETYLAQILRIPTLAATAWYHGRISDVSFEEALQNAKTFAYGPYACALIQGKTEEETLCRNMAHLSGLSYEWIKRESGRIPLVGFLFEFFGDEKKVLGAYDARLVGPKVLEGTDPFQTDPSSAYIKGIYTASFHAYMQKDLNFHTSFPVYEVLSVEANKNWKWPPGELPDFTRALRAALAMNPEMKIFVSGGYFDLVTPFAAAEYTFSQLYLPAQISYGFYEGGHMFYSNPKALKKFRQDLTSFYENEK